MSNTIPATQLKGSYALVNGLQLYYEIHGTGRPLVLLHGGLGSIEMFSEVLPELAASRQVIGVDLQAHGRTPDIDRTMSYEAMADDIAALVKHLGHDEVDLMGYSLGGGTALQTAILHPEVVHRLVLVSVPFARQGWYPESRAGMEQVGPQAAEPMKQSPIYQVYARVAPRPSDWPRLLTQVGNLLRQEYNWAEEVVALRMPVLLIFGDADTIHPEHIVQFYQLLGGGKNDPGWDGSRMPISQLAILPGTTHHNILSSPLLAGAVRLFLDAR